MMRFSASKLFLLILCAVFISTYEITALEAGSVKFQDKLIRLNTCMTKKVELKLTKEYYGSHQDIKVIVSISGIKMDDQLSFYIYHYLNCNKKFCELQINLQRYTPKVNHQFEYELAIDYLVAQGLKTVDFNMTYSKQHFKIPTFQQNMKVEDWTAILIPYGFSDLKILGNVQYQIIPLYDALKLTYLDSSIVNNQVVQTQWNLNSKFVLYKILFLPKKYLQNRQSDQEFTQFVGFKSTKKHQINKQFYFNKLHSLAQLTDIEVQKDQQFRVTLRKTAIFYENRQKFMTAINQIQKNIPYEVSDSNISRYFIGAIILVALQLAYLIYKKKIAANQQSGQDKKAVFPELIMSFEEISRAVVKQPQPRATQSRIDSNKALTSIAQTVL